MWVIFIVSAVIIALISAVVIALIYKIVASIAGDPDKRVKKDNLENEENLK